jgi:uncharacterized protein YbjT (DUF2867 family)
MDDTTALAAAFKDAEGVFILMPPLFDPAPGYPEARRVIEAVHTALDTTRPGRILCLSTVGADAAEDNLLSQLSLMEQTLGSLPMPVTFLRAGWFLDNAAWDVASARGEGIVRSFLQPLDRTYPMVASRDVGRTAAALMRERWQGKRVVRLEGPARVSPNDIAAAFALALDRPVRAEIVPHVQWEDIFRAQGMCNPLPRVRMLDGFNQGWIDFPEGDVTVLKGQIGVAEVIADLVHGATRAEPMPASGAPA